ncbi:MAG: zinc ABC transporter substrate-binding protein [Synechococcus sp.]
MVGRLWFAILLLLFGGLWLSGCQRQTPISSTDDDSRLQISVSIVPQKYFVERVGGDSVSVNVMVEPGDEPHTYEPKPEQLRMLSFADAYMRIGVEFEDAWMDRISAANSEMAIVDLTEGIQRMPIAGHHHHDGEETKHADEIENPDPHIWLSPKLVKVQAKTIFEALVQLDPDNESEYRTNLERFLSEIDILDADISKALVGVKQRKFMVFHPAWGYFARDYDLEMLPIEVGGTEPSASELAALIAEAREEEIRVIFAQPELSSRDAETIAREIDGEVLLISPLEYDWLENMRNIAETFAEVLDRSVALQPRQNAIAIGLPKTSGLVLMTKRLDPSGMKSRLK